MNYLQRKKLAFMKVVSSLKGFVRSIAGIPPLTLPNCVDEDSIINYTINGNSVQSGTPSPDNPIEIDSVGEYDEASGKYKIPIVARGKNICPNDWELGFIDTTTGADTTGNTSNIRTKGYFTFDKNQVYFISSNDLTDTNNITWYFYDENKTFISRAASKRNRTVSVTTNGTQVKIPENAVYYRLVVNVTNVDIKVQLELGTFATECEDYKEPITTDIYLDEPLSSGDSINYKEDNLPSLPTFKGTTVYEIDTEVQPSNMEVTYYSSQKGE